VDVIIHVLESLEDVTHPEVVLCEPFLFELLFEEFLANGSIVIEIEYSEQ